MEPKLRKTYVNLFSQNVRGLIVSGRRMSGLHYLQMSKQNEQKVREKMHTVRPAGLKPRRSFSYTTITKNSCSWLFFRSLLNGLVTWLDLLCDATFFFDTSVYWFKNLKKPGSSQVKLLITNNAFFIVQRKKPGPASRSRYKAYGNFTTTTAALAYGYTITHLKWHRKHDFC
jgi:hypothetical protein